MEKQGDLLDDYAKGKAKQRNARFASARLTDTPETSALWELTDFQKIIDFAIRQKQTVATLRKHLPAIYHERVRVRWSESAWTLSVERPALANELKWIQSKLCDEVALDIGFSPNIIVTCHPKHWETSGERIRHPEKPTTPLPSPDEAEAFIDAFIRES